MMKSQKIASFIQKKGNSFLAIRSLSIWKNVPLAPPDSILGLTESFKNDKFPNKINLGVGAYRTDCGNPFVLNSVKEAEKLILSKGLDKEYLPIQGDSEYIKAAMEFSYGTKIINQFKGQISAIQTLSGTGACRLAGEFLALTFGKRDIYLPNPTWGNHINIFQRSGLNPVYYPYFNPKTLKVDFEKLLEFIKSKENEIFLFHSCAHNPTGCDVTNEQWDILSATIKEKGHIVLFDNAYQGFASGNPEADAYSIRKFVEDGHKIILCQSFAKNFGLYGERVGLLSVVTANSDEADNVESQLKRIARPMYSNPPVHGARIVKKILKNENLKNLWLDECKGMAERIGKMRHLLQGKLESKSSRSWNHISEQIGMFCFTGLTKEEVLRLRSEFHIYCTDDGRFSLAGINTSNIDYLAESILAVTEKK